MHSSYLPSESVALLIPKDAGSPAAAAVAVANSKEGGDENGGVSSTSSSIAATLIASLLLPPSPSPSPSASQTLPKLLAAVMLVLLWRGASFRRSWGVVDRFGCRFGCVEQRRASGGKTPSGLFLITNFVKQQKKNTHTKKLYNLFELSLDQSFRGEQELIFYCKHRRLANQSRAIQNERRAQHPPVLGNENLLPPEKHTILFSLLHFPSTLYELRCKFCFRLISNPPQTKQTGCLTDKNRKRETQNTLQRPRNSQYSVVIIPRLLGQPESYKPTHPRGQKIESTQS